MRNYKEGGKVESKAGSGEMTDTNRRKGALSFELPERTTEGRVNQPRNWPESLNKTTVFCLKL